MTKSLLFLAFYCSISSLLFTQPVFMNAPVDKVDTIFRYVDVSGRVQPPANAPYLQKSWLENGKYLLHLYTNDSANLLVRKTTYADIGLQELDGPFENYYSSGLLKDSGSYAKKMRHGVFKSWYDNGMLLSIYHYANGLKIDTGKTFLKNGALSGISITDQQGNGSETVYYPDGGIHLTGPLAAGVRNGTWTINRPDGTRQMQADYNKDSLTQTICFAEDGTTRLEGPCTFERFARFPGGNEGWRSFLMKNLKYPKAAIAGEIQGTVMLEFTVDTSGTPGDLKVISSPHELLSKEALRLMEISPKWEPAIQYNRVVKGRLRQPIYFRLQ